VSWPEPQERRLALTLDGVGLRYTRRSGAASRSSFWALEDVSFDVSRGETLGVVGRNGAGKSTLMRIMAGILRPDRGELRNHGVTVSLHSLNVGMIPYLTGRENACLSGMLLGLRRREIEERMEAIREFSGLDGFIDQPVATYSSGMLARLGFSVAVQAQPEVLLVDEVWAVGDREFRDRSAAAMREMVRSQQTVVVASHNLDLIRRFCERSVWIEGGRSCLVASSERVLEAYERSGAAQSR